MRWMIAAAVACAPMAALAQTVTLTPQQSAEFTALVHSYLDDVQAHFGADSAPGGEETIAPLEQGAAHRWTVSLRGGGAYRIVGACDNECRNLDIEVIDAHGGVLASDILPDNYPVVDFAPPADGPYTVRVIMTTCTLGPCFAGARILTPAPVAP